MNLINILQLVIASLTCVKCCDVNTAIDSEVFDKVWNILNVVVEDILLHHLYDPQCSLVVSSDDRLVQKVSETIFRNHEHRFSPTGIILNLPETFKEEEPEVNVTLIHMGIPWPAYYFDSVPIGICAFHVIIPTSSDKIDYILEHISSVIKIKPRFDYFLVWPLDTSTVGDDLLLNATRLNQLRYKLAPFKTDENIYTLRAVCFYCNHGDPTLANIGTIEDGNYRIIWNYGVAFPDFTDDLHGRKMRAVYMMDFDAQIAERMKETGELFMHTQIIIPVIAESLNYEWSFYEIDIGEAGAMDAQMDDGSWQGFVADVLYGKADYGIATMTNYKAMPYIDYSYPFYADYLTFTTPKPKSVFGATTLLQPFTANMWGLIGISILLGSVYFYFLLKYIKRSFGNVVLDENIASSSNNQPLFTYSWQYMALSLIGWAPNSMPIAHTSRLFLAFWLIYAMVINTAYQSKLISFMTSPTMEILPDYFEELVDSDFSYGGDKKHILLIQMILENSESATLKRLMTGLKGFDDSNHCLKTSVNERLACTTVSVFLESGMKSILDSGGIPLLKASKENSIKITACSIFPKNFVALQHYDRGMKALNEAGIMYDYTFDKLYYQFFRKGLKERYWDIDLSSGITPLNILQLQGPYFGYFFAIILSLLVFLYELKTKCCSKSKPAKKQNRLK